jgi:ABC-type bacteriocin/lantibiotic exporter with double-glycine peptidase domain
MEILTIMWYLLWIIFISIIMTYLTTIFFILPFVNHICKKMKEQIEKEFNDNL